MTDSASKRRIVVGVDGSEPSRQALRWALRQARFTGATLHAVTAWEKPVGLGWSLVVSTDDVAQASEQMLAETLTTVAGTEPDLPVTTWVAEGHPAQVLIGEAQSAELLVVGSRGHGGFVDAVLGSVSQYCVHHADCSVVVVRGSHT
jgi:nucleotide-binding universal stress UspA family protein